MDLILKDPAVNRCKIVNGKMMLRALRVLVSAIAERWAPSEVDEDEISWMRCHEDVNKRVCSR